MHEEILVSILGLTVGTLGEVDLLPFLLTGVPFYEG